MRDEGLRPRSAPPLGRSAAPTTSTAGDCFRDALCDACAHEHGPGLLVWAELPRKADGPRDPSELPQRPGLGRSPEARPRRRHG
ncbi:hypothetical protein LV779_33175 [Streptomyces thinghirensis]|nr:hypothetical protein [Streptomyces thinghirensis]